MPTAADSRRRFLIELLRAGLAAVDGRARVRAALGGRDDLRDVWVVAAGKAAGTMALGALDAFGARLARALVVARDGDFGTALQQDPRVRCIAGGHPVPDAGSLEAGTAALAMADAAPAGQPVILLVSGGASSLIESPADGVTLEDLQRVGHWALASGLPIEAVNALRRRLSRVKDGRLAAAFGHCRVEGYFVSDVPGDDPALVGSGLLAASAPASPSGDPLPAWLVSLLERGTAPPAAGPRIPIRCVGRIEEAMDAIERQARASGWRVTRPADRLDGDAVAAAEEAGAWLAAGPPGLLLQGGETTVRLPPSPGRGGRNQHLALAAAVRIRELDGCLLLAAGTDGIDGDTPDAGALVDGRSVERGEDAGLDAADCLARADSGRFLEASGDLVHTGPTGTNVGDLLLGLRCDVGHSQSDGPSM